MAILAFRPFLETYHFVPFDGIAILLLVSSMFTVLLWLWQGPRGRWPSRIRSASILGIASAGGVAFGIYGAAGLKLSTTGFAFPIAFLAVPTVWLVAARRGGRWTIASAASIAAVVSVGFLLPSVYFMPGLRRPDPYLLRLYFDGFVSALFGILDFFAIMGLAGTIRRVPNSAGSLSRVQMEG